MDIMSKKILIVYAHPDPKSFTHAILETALECFKARHFEIAVRDLYAMNFSPVMTMPDFGQFAGDSPPPDVEQEQKLIKWCDVIVFLFPLWWSGMPAILKGYIDRVFTYGFAYATVDGKSQGLLKKAVVVFQPQGGPEETCSKEAWPAMDVVTKVYTFEATALKCMGYFRFPSVSTVSKEIRLSYLSEVKKFCSELC
eukprot:TRINITY_DN3396_c0_g1_i1.p1 TRINITY_DN3396_c0_g1~~TRINITY_DN3396_c0_g1_i1.p1  ORF type:complete len:229 (+),score=56.43 TRINITY_DN3396_c0_g1_i1:97-687(+)